MDFKKADKVNYKGSEVVFGVDEKTDQLIKIEMTPAHGTYIHQIIESSNDGNLYIIQHHHGVEKSFFTDNVAFFGTVDVSKMNPKLKYIYVTAEDLELVEERPKQPVQTATPNTTSETPPPTPSEPSQEEQVKQPISEFITDEVTDEETVEDTQEVITEPKEPSGKASSILETEKTHTSVKDVEEPANIHKPIVMSGRPHYTAQKCPVGLMVQVSPISRVLKSMKQPEPFTVELASGKIAEGNGGDFLMLSPDGYCFIEPKETYNRSYMNVAEPLRVAIGENHYIVSPEIKAYIDGLEALNVELRDKLFLEFPQLMKQIEQQSENNDDDGQE